MIITTTRARSKKTRATTESASDGDCLAATTANKSSYSVRYSKAYREERMMLPSANMLSQCLFISTKTKVFVKINVVLLTCAL